MAEDHGYNGNYINSIINLTGSELVLDSQSLIETQWIDYYFINFRWSVVYFDQLLGT